MASTSLAECSAWLIPYFQMVLRKTYARFSLKSLYLK